MSQWKRRWVRWTELSIWFMLFATVIEGRLHRKEQVQAQADAISVLKLPDLEQIGATLVWNGPIPPQ